MSRMDTARQFAWLKLTWLGGVDTTDLYCFVKHAERWTMFLNAFLWKTPRKQDIEFKISGEFIDVICKGAVVLKLSPPNP